MKYALAKSLLDAGYPQGKYGVFINKEGYKILMEGDCAEDKQGFIYVPSVEELIYSLGENFSELTLKAKTFTVTTTNDTKITRVGKTPEIALAHVWIELNK